MITTRHQMGRRDFLRVSSACALVTAVAGPKLFAAAAASAPQRLVVGFASPEDFDGVIAASSIPAGDGAFIGRGARITVHGARRTSAEPRARRTVDLLAHYSYFDGAERKSVPFRAWSCSRASGCEGHRAAFNVPVDEEQKLSFSLETERGTPSGGGASRRELLAPAAERAVSPVTLSLTSEAGSLKLVRGYYILVPLFDSESEPSWSSYELRSHEGRMTLLDRDGNVAPFEYFVLRVDYAPAQ